MNRLETRILKNHGLAKSEKYVSQGKNSGHQAIGMAYMFGAKKIILIGFDMQHTGGKTHWHGDHPKGLGNAVGIQEHAKFFDQLAIDLEQEGVEVVNCSGETALTCFKRQTIEEALQ